MDFVVTLDVKDHVFRQVRTFVDQKGKKMTTEENNDRTMTEDRSRDQIRYHMSELERLRDELHELLQKSDGENDGEKAQPMMGRWAGSGHALSASIYPSCSL